MEESSKALIRSFTGYSAGVMVSRLSGMIRDIALAFFFGTSPEIALFMMAYRFANLMRRMLAESPLSSSFIPAFEAKRKEGLLHSLLFFRDAFFSMAIAVAALVGIAMGGLEGVVRYYRGGELETILHLTSTMMPSLIFICLYAMCSTLLQCEKKFFIPAVAPVAFNAVWISFAILVGIGVLSKNMEVLAVGVIIAFAAQWLVLMPKTLKILLQELSWKELIQPRVFHASLKPLVTPFFLGMLGVGATQINLALDSLFSRVADASGPAFLWYAIRIQQVPMALFGVAISTALLPAISQAIKMEKDWVSLFKLAYEQALSLMVFSTGAILALGSLMVAVLFGRGEFQLASIAETTRCLWCYGLGLVPHAGVLMLASCHYAHEDFKTPMRGAVYAVICNFILNAILVFGCKWGAASVALATSLASMVNFCYLWISFKKFYSGKMIASSFYGKIYGIGAIVTLGVTLFAYMGSRHMHALVVLIGGCISYLAFYCYMEKMLRCEGVFNLVKRWMLLKKR